jgi:methylenetetrahydrofolate reductase (NADPH)
LLIANGKTDGLKVLVGMGPLKSAKQALWMRENLWGVNISDAIISRLDASKNPKKEGLMICQELISKLIDLPGIDGVHLMGPSCESDAADIIKLFR